MDPRQVSGGSYNYLCYATTQEHIGAREGTLRLMYNRLMELAPTSSATLDTRDLIRLLDQAQALAEKLSDVWYAVEWADSSDWTIEDAMKEIGKYGR